MTQGYCLQPQAGVATLTGKRSDFAKSTYPYFNFIASQVHVSAHCHKSLLLNKYPRQRQNQALPAASLSATGFGSLVHQPALNLGLTQKTTKLLSSAPPGNVHSRVGVLSSTLKDPADGWMEHDVKKNEEHRQKHSVLEVG